MWYLVITYHCGSHKEGHSTRKLEKPCRGALRASYAEKFTMENSEILMNPQAYLYLRDTGKRTHSSWDTKTYL